MAPARQNKVIGIIRELEKLGSMAEVMRELAEGETRSTKQP